MFFLDLKHVKKGDKYESTKSSGSAKQSSNLKKKEEQSSQSIKTPKKYQKDNWFVVRLHNLTDVFHDN